MWSLAICVAGPCGIMGSTICMYPCTNCSTVRSSYSAQCPVLANHTLWGHCAVRGGLLVGFWDNPPVADWSVIPAHRRMRWACWAELASALKAAAGSDICCKSCGSNPALLSCLGLEVRWLQLQQGDLWNGRQLGRPVLGSRRELAV